MNRHERKNMTYHLSTKRLFRWREQRCSQHTPGFGHSPGANIPITHDLHNSLWQILLSTFAIWDNISPEHFQKRMDKVLEDLPGVLCMMDDIIIYGESPEEHDARVRTIFRCLEDNGVTLNFEKCDC